MSSLCTEIVIPLCSPEEAKTPTSIALGSFDGLHAGHRKVIEIAVKSDDGMKFKVSLFMPEYPENIMDNRTNIATLTAIVAIITMIVIAT